MAKKSKSTKPAQNADPDRVPLSQAMKKPSKSKRAKKVATETPTAATGANPRRSRKDEATGQPKRASGLDAAAQVLAAAAAPMNAKDIVKAMADQGLWTSPGGKTPHATIYAAMVREITTKGDKARFKKTDRGLFTAA